MMIAQQLYEGVEITGEGSVGLITYMRTDSLRISEEALEAAGKAITARYGAAYYSGPRRCKPKSGAQDAHEAIRPSNVALYPENVQKDLTKDQYQLYKLIWSRFIASQMEKRRLRRDGHRGRMRKASVPRDASEPEIRRFHGNL